ncbi:MAG: HNH endonuclease signature motif containing protein [Chloroflexi bacterium]|nr:HNH endonuclease signature motif containing protein [Chloroflexota bacterium]
MKRKGPRWDALALQIRERDEHACQNCGERGNEVDHITPIRAGGAMWDPENLQVLCSSCHVRKTRREYGVFNETKMAKQSSHYSISMDRQGFRFRSTALRVT